MRRSGTRYSPHGKVEMEQKVQESQDGGKAFERGIYGAPGLVVRVARHRGHGLLLGRASEA